MFQTPLTAPALRSLQPRPGESPRRFTWRAMTSSPRYLVPAATLSVLHQLGEALVPVVMGVAIDRAIAGTDPGQRLIWLVVLAADFALLSFSYRFGSRLALIGEQAVQHRLREQALARLMHDDGPALPAGAALSLVTSDVRRVAVATRIMVFSVGELAAIVFGGIVLLRLSWPIGLAVLLGAPLLLWLTERLGAWMRRTSTAEQSAAADAAGTAADLMQGYRLIRGLSVEPAATARYRTASRTALRATLRARNAESGFTALTEVTTGLFVAVIAVVTAAMALGGAFGIGSFVAVVGLAQFLLSPLQQVARNAGTTWASATASAGRLLALETSVSSSPPPDPSPQDSRPTDAPSADAVLDLTRLGVEDGVGPGEVVAIDLGAQPPSAARWSQVLGPTWRDAALVVPHSPDLFAGSIRENVALQRDGGRVDPATVEAALRAAGCDQLRTADPRGYDAPVGERGGLLSGGQRQRVALARAYAQRAPVLILHDPTSAVDTVTEAEIGRSLRAIRGTGRTIIVTSSPTWHAVADRVLTADACQALR